MALINDDFIKECFALSDGGLTWKHRPASHFASVGEFRKFNARYAGQKVGVQSIDGYHRVRVTVGSKRVKLLAHRIIFLLEHGFLPKEIDHKDGNRSNNQISNLRAATSSENKANALSRRDDGVKGVYWNADRNKWAAYIRENGKKVFLGRFDQQAEAHQAYKTAAVRIYGDFARV